MAGGGKAWCWWSEVRWGDRGALGTASCRVKRGDLDNLNNNFGSGLGYGPAQGYVTSFKFPLPTSQTSKTTKAPGGKMK